MKRRVVEPVQRRQEFADIIGAARADADQIDAGRKNLALPGQHHGLGVGAAQLVETRGQRLAEFDVERIGLAVRERQHRNAGVVLDIDHAACPAAATR